MKNWYEIFPKNTGLSLYIWIIFCILPFYFIFKSSSKLEIIIGILMICLFFTAYRLSFISISGSVYMWIAIEMIISVFMTLLFGYVYFALFLGFFIGNIQSKVGFITLYIVHLLTTIAAITIGFFINIELFLPQLPYIIISLIGIILLPVNIYNRNKQEKLEGLLDDANKKLARFAIIEERERIARDLHDTLGQKLSMIGLKSDLAGKLINKQPDAAKNELHDIHRTARTALKEVRELVSHMRGIKLVDEIIRVKQMLRAAQIDVSIKGNTNLADTPLLVENVLSMSLKEAVTNVVKHSKASSCHIDINQTREELIIQVKDNGIGLYAKNDFFHGHGLRGMKERLEFMNGRLDILSNKGTTLTISMPKVILNKKLEG